MSTRTSARPVAANWTVSRIVVALAFALPLSVVLANPGSSGESIQHADNANALQNVRNAKKLLKESVKKCICKLIGDAVPGGPPNPPVKVCIDPDLPGNANGATTWNSSGPQYIALTTSFNTTGLEDGNLLLWTVAATLAHEKARWDYRSDPDHRPGGTLSDGSPKPGKAALDQASLHAAACARLEVWCQAVDAANATPAPPKGSAEEKKLDKIKEFFAGEEAAAKKEKKDTESSKQIGVPPDWRSLEDRVLLSEIAASITLRDDTIYDGQGLKATVAGYTVRTNAVSYWFETGGVWGIDGLASSEPYFIGITPSVGGQYDDDDMLAVEYAEPGSVPSGQQLRGYFGLAQQELDVDCFRVTAFVWPASTVMDWSDPDFAGATRVDLEDVPVVDLRTQTNAAGDSITVSTRYPVEDEFIDVTFDGPASTSVDLIAYRKNADGTYPTVGDTVAQLTTDASGTAQANVAMPSVEGSVKATQWQVALQAEYVGDSVGVELVVHPYPTLHEPFDVIATSDDVGHAFAIGLPSIERSIGDTTADLVFGFHNFAPNWKVQVYATRKQQGVYDDNMAVQLTSMPVTMTSDHIELTIPCTYTCGQAYRLTGLGWPPGVTPSVANLPQAIRLDIEDVLPYFESVSEDLEDVHAVAVDDVWAISEQELTVKLYVDEGDATYPDPESTVTVTYEVGVDGDFDSPVTVASGVLVAEADSTSLTFTAPTVEEASVLRITAQFASPTAAFPTVEKSVGAAVFPFEAPTE